jgi:putative ABC transport system ATP-binding protein
MQEAVTLRNVRFAYRPPVEILNIPEMRIGSGEKVFLFGPSGSGKTTLLGLIAGVLPARAGSVSVLGQDLTRMSSAARDAFRGAHIGYIFQLFNLIPYLSVLENVMLPCQVNAVRKQRLGKTTVEDVARELLHRLGLGTLAAEQVTRLSVGQQQRVAVARALLGRPEIIMADEPTSSLDTDHQAQFLQVLFDCCGDAGTTLIFVSHDRSLLPLFDRGLSLPTLNTVSGG